MRTMNRREFGLMTAMSLLVTLPLGNLAAAQEATPTNPAASASPAAETGLQNTTLRQDWQTTGNPAQAIFAGGSVSVAPDGNIWVFDGGGGVFQIFSPDGKYLESWDGSGDGVEGFKFSHDDQSYEGDVAFGADGTIATLERGARRVRIYNADRTLRQEWGGFGPQDGHFVDATGLALDGDGNVYVSDEGRGDVQAFTPDGTFLRSIGGAGSGDGQLENVKYLTVSPDGNVLAMDRGAGEVKEYTSDGKFVRQIGGESGLQRPEDVAVDAAGNIYVADTNSGRIVVFDPEGNELVAWETGKTMSGGLNLPYAVAVDGAGAVYVSGVGMSHDDESNLQKFTIEPAS